MLKKIALRQRIYTENNKKCVILGMYEQIPLDVHMDTLCKTKNVTNIQLDDDYISFNMETEINEDDLNNLNKYHSVSCGVKK